MLKSYRNFFTEKLENILIFEYNRKKTVLYKRMWMIMLKRFEVKNYKNFKERIVIDFSKVGGYQFNLKCITNQLLSKMIIYGRNASGKTNLGNAIFDIKQNLFGLDLPRVESGSYLNADSQEMIAEFKYVFQFGKEEVVYQYHKSSAVKLYDEELLLGNKQIFSYNFVTETGVFENLRLLGADTIVIERYLQSRRSDDEESKNVETLSFLRWLINNTVLPNDSILLKLDMYVRGMTAITVGNIALSTRIATRSYFVDKLEDIKELDRFEDFLNRMGIECKLAVRKLPDGQNQLYFKHDTLVPFFETASSGTLALTNLYQRFGLKKMVSMLFFDEFDAFYHYEMSENVVKFFKEKYSECQVIMTTHNTNLMTNRLMRPDCLMILSRQGVLTALCDATERELREGHNLEKMYISGEFEQYE